MPGNTIKMAAGFFLKVKHAAFLSRCMLSFATKSFATSCCSKISLGAITTRNAVQYQTQGECSIMFKSQQRSPLFCQKRHITLLTTFNVVDNSQLGQRTKRYRKPYLIGFYGKKKTAEIGDVIRVAVRGKTNKAIVVGTRRTKHHTLPRYDNNNIVLVDDNLAPLGTRIKGPIPSIIRRRKDKYSKVLAIASRYI